MTKKQALAMLMLLSALESWAYSVEKPLPVFLKESLKDAIDVLAKFVADEWTGAA